MPVETIDYVKCCEILDDDALNVSRHRPIVTSLEFTTNSNLSDTKLKVVETVSKINWKGVKESDKDDYVSAIKAKSELLRLKHCELNRSDVDNAYTTVIKAITESSACLPVSKYKQYLKPYWSIELGNAHTHMKEKRRLWCREGRPRDITNLFYIEYKNAKRDFKRLHNYHVNQYLRQLDHEIDKTAEADSEKFWKIVNSRKNSTKCSSGAGIKFNDTIYRDKQDLTEQWGLYFKDLYSPSVNADFDADWYQHVNSTLQSTIETISPDVSTTVLPQTVSELILSCPKGKACGHDNVFYEHLILARDILSPILANIFSYMLRLSYIPDEMKKGIIITLNNGGKKRKDDPNNYRAI